MIGIPKKIRKYQTKHKDSDLNEYEKTFMDYLFGDSKSFMKRFKIKFFITTFSQDGKRCVSCFSLKKAITAKILKPKKGLLLRWNVSMFSSKYSLGR